MPNIVLFYQNMVTDVRLIKTQDYVLLFCHKQMKRIVSIVRIIIITIYYFITVRFSESCRRR